MSNIRGNLLLVAALTTLLLVPAQSYGYIVTGTIVDETSKPIRKAVVIGRNSENKVRIGIETDERGMFGSVNVEDSTLAIEIAKDGYTPVYIDVAGTSEAYLDLGIVTLSHMTVNLDEVTVTAKPVTRKADRLIIIPSVKEMDQSSNGLSLLSTLQSKVPGLMVNEELQSVTVGNSSPVLKINGKQSDMNHYLSINPNNVLRIEYHDSPDIRYGNRQVIDVITKPRNDGGYVVANLQSAVTTGFINGNVGANYHYKKSEFDLNYGINWRNYDNRRIDATESFIAPDNTIVRESSGVPSDFSYTTHNLSFDYTYMHNSKTIFSIGSGVTFDNQDMNDNSLNTETTGNIVKNFSRLVNRNNDFVSPYFDLFFKKQFDDSQFIEVNAFGRYSSGDFGRENHDIYDTDSLNEHWTTKTSNDSWRYGAEAMYSKSFSKNFTANFGVWDYLNTTDNTQTTNGVASNDKIDQNRLTAYAQLYGRVKKFSYSANLGYVYNHSSNNDYVVNASRFKSNITLDYALSNHVSLNYLFMYSPSMPTTSQQSELIQPIDGISVRQGNPDLKPSEYIRNRIYVSYSNKKFDTSLWLSQSRTNKPIYYNYSYIDDETSPYAHKFLSKAINGQHNDLLNVEWFVTLSRLFDHLTLWGKLGWDYYYNIELDGKSYDKSRVYGTVNGSFYWGNWLVSANYQLRTRHNLSGNTFGSEERWSTLRVQYHYKSWYFSVSGANLFTKRGAIYEALTLSDVHPSTSTVSIKDNANMIILGVSYRLDFGKKLKQMRRSLHNDGIDKGVDINY